VKNAEVKLLAAVNGIAGFILSKPGQKKVWAQYNCAAFFIQPVKIV
jgi:hypothetical protein